MKKHWTAYFKATGKIIGNQFSGADVTDDGVSDSPDIAVIQGESDPDADYVTGSPLEVTARPATTIMIDTTTITAGASPEDVALIENIPNPSTVIVTDSNGITEDVETSGSYEIVADVPDTIGVRIAGTFPELGFEATVVAS